MTEKERIMELQCQNALLERKLKNLRSDAIKINNATLIQRLIYLITGRF